LGTMVSVSATPANIGAPTRAVHFTTLDGLRGVAAIAVVMLHSTLLLNHRLSWHVELAVDFFFVLSGFVVAKAYEGKLRASMTVLEFAKIRLVRLYPMIFIGVLFGFGVIVLRLLTHNPYSGKQLLIVLVSGLLLLPTTVLGHSDVYPANSPSWSLFFELAINFVYALTVRWLNTLRLIVLCGVSAAALCIAAKAHHGVNLGFLPGTWWLGFVRVTFPFSAGVLLSRCRNARPVGAAATIVLALVLLTVLCVPFYVGSWVYDCVIVAFVFPAIVFCGTGCKSSPILDKSCIALGELSYPLYITHQPLLRIISNAIGIFHWHIASVLAILLSTAATIPAAVLFLKIWDRPVRGWLNGRFIKTIGRVAPPIALPSRIGHSCESSEAAILWTAKAGEL
jgi:peptidoglycan/LPS O-acetylase OafA/YrhL